MPLILIRNRKNWGNKIANANNPNNQLFYIQLKGSPTWYIDLPLSIVQLSLCVNGVSDKISRSFWNSSTPLQDVLKTSHLQSTKSWYKLQGSGINHVQSHFFFEYMEYYSGATCNQRSYLSQIVSRRWACWTKLHMPIVHPLFLLHIFCTSCTLK